MSRQCWWYCKASIKTFKILIEHFRAFSQQNWLTKKGKHPTKKNPTPATRANKPAKAKKNVMPRHFPLAIPSINFPFRDSDFLSFLHNYWKGLSINYYLNKVFKYWTEVYVEVYRKSVCNLNINCQRELCRPPTTRITHTKQECLWMHKCVEKILSPTHSKVFVKIRI